MFLLFVFVVLFLKHNSKIGMSNVKFTRQELRKFIAYYSKEKLELEEKLEHVNEMLSKLGDNVSIKSSLKAKLTAKGELHKKRGPKSVWGTFIIKRLRARNKPLNYSDLIDDAMAIHKISEERKNNAKASILNAAFRLRTKEGKIVTVGRKGRKEKLLVLTKWLNEDGSLKEEYAKAFKKLQGGKAEKVVMSTIPSLNYQDEEV